jgi:hypothetical protein
MTTFRKTSSVRALGEMKMESKVEILLYELHLY